MSTTVLIDLVDHSDLQKLRQASKFSAQAKQAQHALFSLKKVQYLYSDIAKKYQVDKSEVIKLAKDLSVGDEGSFDVQMLSGFRTLKNSISSLSM